MATAFTAHNVRLDDGTFTMPKEPSDMAHNPWFKAAKRALTLAFPAGLANRRIVDLGCLEGGFTTEFARLGMDALGIEVRKSNFDNCTAVKARVNLPNLKFAHDTVWNLASYGKFDAVFCSGLLYHLDRPREFIRIVSEICETVCVIHTHFATSNDADNLNLSPIAENEGLKGRWFKEHDDLSIDELEKLKWAAWENRRSFWPMREELVGIIGEAGFDMVFEQYDFLPNLREAMMIGDYKTNSRSLFVGVRTGIV